MPPSHHCAICWNYFAVDSVIIFPCGHGYCSTCTDTLFAAGRTKCPNCRKIIHKRDGHPVYLELIDSATLFVERVIEGVDQMDVDTPLVSMKKTIPKVEQALEAASEDTLSRILRALEDYKTRIIPMGKILESLKLENENIRKDLQKRNREKEKLESKLKDAEASAREVVRLNVSLAEANTYSEQALRLAEVAKDELEKERKTTEYLKEKINTLESENNRFRDRNERHKSHAKSLQEKYKKVEAKYLSLKEQRQVQESQDLLPINDYDADFSSHEQSRIHTVQSAITSTSSRLTRRPFNDENDVELDCQGMLPPTFTSDWQTDGSIGPLKKRAPNGLVLGTHRRVANSFPIELDKKGHPTRTVQIGPRSILHVRR